MCLCTDLRPDVSVGEPARLDMRMLVISRPARPAARALGRGGHLADVEVALPHHRLREHLAFVLRPDVILEHFLADLSV